MNPDAFPPPHDGAILSASILAADLANLQQDCEKVLSAGMNAIHFDVMDHHYVPNLSFGADICRCLRHSGITAPIDVHLMVTNPEKYIDAFASAGANLITFHPETCADPIQLIQKIHDQGMKAGVAYNPDQTPTQDPELWQCIDYILLMSVFPGFGGQSFIESVLDKISHCRQIIQKIQRPIYLAVDGGINLDTIAACAQHGADFFVVGSGVFKANNYEDRVAALRKNIEHTYAADD